MRFEEEYRAENQTKRLDETMIRQLAERMTDAALERDKTGVVYSDVGEVKRANPVLRAAGTIAVAAAVAFAAIVVVPRLAREGLDTPQRSESAQTQEHMTESDTSSQSVSTEIAVQGDYPVFALNTLVAESDLIAVANVTEVKYVTTTTDSFWNADSLYAVYEIRLREKLKGDGVSGESLQIFYSLAEFEQFGALDVSSDGEEQYLFFLSVTDDGRGQCRLMNPFQSCYRISVNALESEEMPSVGTGNHTLSITMKDVRQAVDLDRFGWLESIRSLKKLCTEAEVIVGGTMQADGDCFCEQEGGMHYKIHTDYVLSGNVRENQELSLCLTQKQMELMCEITDDKSFVFFLTLAEEQPIGSVLYAPVSTSQGIYYYGSSTPYLYSAVGNQSVPTFMRVELERTLDEINAEIGYADAVRRDEEAKRQINCDVIMQEYLAAQMEGIEYGKIDKINRYLNELFFFDTELPDGVTFSSISKEDTELMTWLVQQAQAGIWRENDQIAQKGHEIAFSGGTAEWLENTLRETVSPEITLPDGADYAALAEACNGLEYGEDGFYQTLPNGWGIMDEIRSGGSALFYHVTRAYEYEGKIYASAYKYLLKADEEGNGLVYDGDTRECLGTFEIGEDGALHMTADTATPSEEIFVLESAEEYSTYGYFLVTKK